MPQDLASGFFKMASVGIPIFPHFLLSCWQVRKPLPRVPGATDPGISFGSMEQCGVLTSQGAKASWGSCSPIRQSLFQTGVKGTKKLTRISKSSKRPTANDSNLNAKVVILM